MCHNQVLRLSCSFAEVEHVPSLRRTNEIAGAYVTEGGRIHLYRYLDRIQDKTLYCDRFCDLCPAEGRTRARWDWGQFAVVMSELKPGEFISDFVIVGPKYYAYKTVNSRTVECKTVWKVRGIKMNYNSSQLVNFDRIRHDFEKGGRTHCHCTHG
jgi:hypothetical protein